MKKLLVPFLTTIATLLSAGAAQANWFGDDCQLRAQWAPFYPPEPAFLPQCYTCYKPEWRQEKVDVVVQRWHCKQVVDKVKILVMVPVWEDQKQLQLYYAPVTRIIERDVVRCRNVPAWSFDPCTCCPTLCWKVETYVEHVKTEVCEFKTECREVIGKLCRMVPEERVIDQCRLEWFSTPETVSYIRCYCVMVPYTQQVCLPVLLPHYGPPVCPWNW